jgi:antitoxin component YwqK of YwqJK toxin-antitoxin module
MSIYIEEYYKKEDYIIECYIQGDERDIEEYYNNNKIIKFKGLKVNGKKEGDWIEGILIGYNENGYYYYYKKINYINNIKNGEYKEYYRNNILKAKGNYINDKLEGEYK